MLQFFLHWLFFFFFFQNRYRNILEMKKTLFRLLIIIKMDMFFPFLLPTFQSKWKTFIKFPILLHFFFAFHFLPRKWLLVNKGQKKSCFFCVCANSTPNLHSFWRKNQSTDKNCQLFLNFFSLVFSSSALLNCVRKTFE